MCSDSQDDELRELVRRNYNEVNREYLKGQMEHALSYMPEDDINASQRTSTTAPVATPATAPLYVNLRQKRDNIIAGPKAEPKPAHAFSTRFIIA